jgi:hypothetical protein
MPVVDSAQGLIEQPDGCPDCATPWGRIAPVPTNLLDGVSLIRCTSCGSRWDGASPPRRIRDCEQCGPAVFPEGEDGRLCGACAEAEVDVPAQDARLIVAAEVEVRRALADVWRFARSETLATYLDRVCRDTARAIPGAPDEPRVVVVDTDEWRTFALPSGVVLIGRGTLAALADEAELAFVLGHELAHVALGDAGTGLLRAGLRTMARGRREDSGRCWLRGVEERLKLGYGDEREFAADGLAVDALVALDYDVMSIGTCLSRFGERVACGDPAVAESALAHPPFDSRLHAADLRLAEAAVRQSAPRINREIFRRAAGHTVLTRELVPAALAHGAAEQPARKPRSRWLLAFAFAALAALIALLFRLAG